jgi:hypothetical protein
MGSRSSASLAICAYYLTLSDITSNGILEILQSLLCHSGYIQTSELLQTFQWRVEVNATNKCKLMMDVEYQTVTPLTRPSLETLLR